MKFGIVLPSYGPQAGRLAMVDCANAAEALGFDSIWLTDHLLLPESDANRFGAIFESISTLSYLAAMTSRIHLGISSLVLPQRNPIEVAKQLATVDNLSSGRVMLAVGVGLSAGEFANLGYDFHDRGQRLDEYLKILRTLWRGGSLVSFSGKYFRFEKAVFAPPPVQAGGPELWVGGNSPAALRRAVLLADGWHPDSIEPGDLSLQLAAVRPLLLNRPFAVAMRMRLDFNARPGEAFLAGAVDQVTEKLRALQAAGLTHAALVLEAPSNAARERAMQTIARQVIPALRT
jgi:probable F420-dependent oxidoreductase